MANLDSHAKIAVYPLVDVINTARARMPLINIGFWNDSDYLYLYQLHKLLGLTLVDAVPPYRRSS